MQVWKYEKCEHIHRFREANIFFRADNLALLMFNQE